MVNPEDEIHIDFQTSVTKEEAVAKMLGWMQGPIYPKYIQVTENGISADQLTSLHFMDGSLKEQLLELRETARSEFLDAVEADLPFETIREKEEAVEKYDALIKKAASYLLDMEDEIAKGEFSALRIDKHRTDKTGNDHITLRSLERWAQSTYGICIANPLESPSVTNDSSIQKDSRRDEATSPKGGLSQVSADNLRTSFAFLVEAFAKTAPKFRRGEDQPNVSAIAKHIAGIALEASKPNEIGGQGYEAIKDRIEDAMDTKKAKLLGK